MTKKRILIFATAYHPFIGGAEVAAREITKRLSENFEFDLLTVNLDGKQPQKEIVDTVTVFRPTKSKILFPFAAYRLAKKLQAEKKYDATWAIMASYAGFAALFFSWAEPKVPMILTLQEGDTHEELRRKFFLVRPIWKMIFRRAKIVQVISGYLENFASRFRRGGVIVVPNGVDVEFFSKSRGNRKEIRKSFGVQSDETLLITTSRLVAKNDVGSLIASLKFLPKSVKLLVIGTGELSQKLQNQAREQDLADRVRFLGVAAHEDIPAYLQAADIFARPSLSEGFGNSFVEAMAAGLPVVATPVGGITDFLKDRETGIFCKVRDPESLAQAIMAYLEDPNLRNAVIKNALEMIKAKYDWDHIAEDMRKIFNVVDGKKPDKILVATGIYPPSVGGPATYSALLERELPGRGIGVKVVTFDWVRRFPRLIRHVAFFLIVLKNLRGVSLIYAQDPVSVGLPAWLAARLCRKTFWIRVAGDYAWEQARQRFGVTDSIDAFQKKKYSVQIELLRAAQTFVISHADTIIVPSNYFKAIVSGWSKRPLDVKRIYNGIDLAPFLSLPVKKADNAPTLFSSGRLVPWKGFDVLFETMRELRKTFPHIRLRVAGDGPDRHRLEEKIKALSLQDHVALLGSLEASRIRKELSQSNVYVLHTGFESFSFAVVEAMAAGVPVVTTRIGNLPEIVEDGEEGFLVAYNDTEALVGSIQKILQDENLHQKLSLRAREKAQQFSITKTLDEMYTLLCES